MAFPAHSGATLILVFPEMATSTLILADECSPAYFAAGRCFAFGDVVLAASLPGEKLGKSLGIPLRVMNRKVIVRHPPQMLPGLRRLEVPDQSGN